MSLPSSLLPILGECGSLFATLGTDETARGQSTKFHQKPSCIEPGWDLERCRYGTQIDRLAPNQVSHGRLWKRGIAFGCLNELADGLVVVLQCKDYSADLLQEVLRAEEVDGEAGRGEVDAGRQLAEPAADEVDGAVLGRDLDVAGAGRREQRGQIMFRPGPATQFAVASLRLRQPFQGRDQFQPAAHEGIPGAVGGAAEAEDAPSDSLGDAEDLLEGAAVDPVRIQGPKSLHGLVKAMKISGSGGHSPTYHNSLR